MLQIPVYYLLNSCLPGKIVLYFQPMVTSVPTVGGKAKLFDRHTYNPPTGACGFKTLSLIPLSFKTEIKKEIDDYEMYVLLMYLIFKFRK